MSLTQRLGQKYAGNPVLLIVAAIGMTMSIFGVYRYTYKPWERKQRLLQAEGFANFLLEKEKND